MDLKECMDSIRVAKDRYQWWSFASHVNGPSGSIMAEHFLSC
jgi:hypothetical protein